MVINDLKESCTQCKGSGRLAGITNMGISQINIGGLCPRCKGRGFLLTELGQDVLNLLRPFLEELVAEAMPAPTPAPREDEESEDSEG